VICVANDLGVEPPVLVDPSLPTVIGFVVLLSVYGRVMQVLNQELELFEERLANSSRLGFQGLVESLAVLRLRQERLAYFVVARFFNSPFRWTIISSAVLKVPWKGPFSASSS
jgi:hypothetical protein